MNWSQTKLIFLVAFLILDMYLGYQLYNKRTTADQIPPTVEKSSPKKDLANGQIKLPSNLPQESMATYIRGEAMSFTEPKPAVKQGNGKGTNAGSNKQNQQSQQSQQNKKPSLKPKIKELAVSDKQKISAESGGTVIYSQFTTPKQISGTSSNGNLSAFVKAHIYKGSEYQLWKKKGNQAGMVTAIFVQTYKNHPIFSKGQYQTGTLQIYMTDSEVTGYRQSYLKLKPFNKSDEKSLISPLKAVDTLYGNEDFLTGSTVESVELSYFNMIAGREKIRLFVPTWHVKVMLPDKKTEKEFFVNAITGEIQTINQTGTTTGTKQSQPTNGGTTNGNQ